jgi:hypothetical protein
MKKVLFVLLTIGLLLPVTASAAPPDDVDGYFVYTPTGCAEIKRAGKNEIGRDCADVGDYYHGDFLGISEEVYDLVLHNSQGDLSQNIFDFERGWYKGTVIFTGEVEGRTGTMQIMFVGKSPGDIFVWSGTWRILGGTGDLANIHGNGAWASSEDPNLPGVHYWGKIKFAP